MLTLFIVLLLDPKMHLRKIILKIIIQEAPIIIYLLKIINFIKPIIISDKVPILMLQIICNKELDISLEMMNSICNKLKTKEITTYLKDLGQELFSSDMIKI